MKYSIFNDVILDTNVVFRCKSVFVKSCWLSLRSPYAGTATRLHRCQIYVYPWNSSLVFRHVQAVIGSTSPTVGRLNKQRFIDSWK